MPERPQVNTNYFLTTAYTFTIEITVMSMLSGWIAPTAGTAILNGHNIRKNLQKARSSIGYCPQVPNFAYIYYWLIFNFTIF